MTAPVRVRYASSPAVSDEQLNALYSESWPHHKPFDFMPVLEESLGYICAYEGATLIGFVYLAWDGAQHAFLLEPPSSLGGDTEGLGRNWSGGPWT